MTETMKLGGKSKWGTFELNGKGYEFELWEALEFIGEIANRHQDDMNECLDCHVKFSNPQGERPDGWELTCEKCGSTNVRPDQTFVDEMVKMMKVRYGVPKCARNEAREFERMVREATEAEKKTPTPTAD